MLIHLYWIDKSNKRKGEGSEAHNEHLYVDYAKRIFQYSINYYGADNSAKNVEVARRSDLRDYMKYLESECFTKCKF